MEYREVPGGWVCGDAPAKAGFGGNIETANQMRLTFEVECRRLETQLTEMIGMRNDLRQAYDNLLQRAIDLEKSVSDIASLLQSTVGYLTLLWGDYLRMPVGDTKETLKELINQAPAIQSFLARLDKENCKA